MKRLFSAIPIPFPRVLIRGLCAAYIAAAGFSPLMAAAYDPGYVPYGRIDDRTPVVTNAWEAVSNKTHNLIENVAPVPGAYATVSNAAMNALSRAEAGLSGWSITPFYSGEWYVQFEGAIDGLHVGGWHLFIDGEDHGFYEASEYATNLYYTDYTVTRTRLPTMADLDAIGSPDFTTNNQTLVDTIVAKSPPPDLSGVVHGDDREADKAAFPQGLKFRMADSDGKNMRLRIEDPMGNGLTWYSDSSGTTFGRPFLRINCAGIRYPKDVDAETFGLLEWSDFTRTHTIHDTMPPYDTSQQTNGNYRFPISAGAFLNYFWNLTTLPTAAENNFANTRTVKAASNLVDRTGALVKAEDIEERAAMLVSTNTIHIYAYSEWTSNWPIDDDLQPLQPVWSNGTWSVTLKWVDADEEYGPYSVEGEEDALTFTVSIFGYATTFTRTATSVGDRNAYGLARLTDLASATNELHRSLALKIPSTNGFVTASITNGFVTASITNGLATTSITNGLVTASITNGFVTASITNGLASTSITNGFVTASITNGLVTASITNGLATTSITNGFVTASITNGLATTSITNGFVTASITNGLVTASITNGLVTSSITNGLVTASITNGLARLTDLTTATNDLHKSIAPTIPSTNGFVTASITNGLVTASITNGLVTASITNGLVTASITNGLATTSITNGFVTASITNGLVTASITNGLATTTYADSAASSAASSAVDSADTSYPRYTTITNLNQSVQYVSITDPSPSTLAITIPTNGATKDWIVYVTAVTNVSLSLPPATYWMADTAYTNDIAPATPTALYFSEATSGVYVIGRQELTPITIAQP